MEIVVVVVPLLVSHPNEARNRDIVFVSNHFLDSLIAVKAAGHVCSWFWFLAVHVVGPVVVALAFIEPAMSICLIKQKEAILVESLVGHHSETFFFIRLGGVIKD